MEPEKDTDRTGHEPQRTCIGCRRRAPARNLVRFAVVAGRVVRDERRRLTGRGAWLCRHPQCLRKALRKHAFQRAFRREVEPPAVGSLEPASDAGRSGE